MMKIEVGLGVLVRGSYALSPSFTKRVKTPINVTSIRTVIVTGSVKNFIISVIII